MMTRDPMTHRKILAGAAIGTLLTAIATAAPPVHLKPPTPELNPWVEQGIPSHHGFGAWYTRKHVADDWHQESRTDEFADVMIRFPGTAGELLFWRGTSYLPCWNDGGKTLPYEEIIPRKGDGPAGRPDKVNRFASARIIESTPKQVIVHWRYMPEMPVDVGPANLPDQTRMVDEYFVITPDRTVVRAVLAGQPHYPDWRHSAPGRLFRYHLGSEGIGTLPAEPTDRDLMLHAMGFTTNRPALPSRHRCAACPTIFPPLWPPSRSMKAVAPKPWNECPARASPSRDTRPTGAAESPAPPC